MFERIKAKAQVLLLNAGEIPVFPTDKEGMEIFDSLVLEGAPVKVLNNTTYEVWKEKRKHNGKLYPPDEASDSQL